MLFIVAYLTKTLCIINIKYYIWYFIDWITEL